MWYARGKMSELYYIDTDDPPNHLVLEHHLGWLRDFDAPAAPSVGTLINQTIFYIEDAEIRPRLKSWAKKLGVILTLAEDRSPTVAWNVRFNRGMRFLARALGGQAEEIGKGSNVSISYVALPLGLRTVLYDWNKMEWIIGPQPDAE